MSPGGIRRRKPSKQEAADLRLGPRGQRDQPSCSIISQPEDGFSLAETCSCVNKDNSCALPQTGAVLIRQITYEYLWTLKIINMATGETPDI